MRCTSCESFICLDDLDEFRKKIRHLHEKIDHLLRRQYNRLFEIQQIQDRVTGTVRGASPTFAVALIA
jgi:hypothetical protein